MAEGSSFIVVVDDDPGMCNALTRLLVASGMNVKVFRSGDELLQAGTDFDVRCFVLDVQLPDMTGFELFDRLSAGRTLPPVIFMTAYDQPSVRQQALARGTHYFLKPFPGHDLLAAIPAAPAFSPAPQQPA